MNTNKGKATTRESRIHSVIVLAGAAIASLFFYHEPLFNHYLVDDDVFQHLFWMDQFQDARLFRNDLMTVYAQAIQPPGFAFLYYVASYAIDCILLSKLLPIAAMVLSSWWLYLIVKESSHSYAGLLAVLIFLATPAYYVKLEGGLPRTFGLPLFLLLVLYLQRTRPFAAAGVICLQGLFYPLIAPLSALLFASYGLLRPGMNIGRGKVRLFVPLLLCTLFCGTLYLYQQSAVSAQGFGPVASRTEVVSQPEFAQGGRVPVDLAFMDGILENIARSTFFTGLPDIGDLNRYDEVYSVCFIVLLFALLIFLHLRNWHSVRRLFLLAMLSSVIMYSIAVMFPLRLYLPARQLEFALPVLVLIVIARAAAYVIDLIGSRMEKGRLVRQIAPILITGVAVTGLFLTTRPSYLEKRQVVDLEVYSGLFSALASLPPGSVVGAHPHTGDPIPAMSGRKTVMNSAMLQPFFRGYWEAAVAATHGLLATYYAGDIEELNRRAKENGIDYFVLDRRHFRGTGALRTWEPLNSWDKSAKKGKSTFALLDLPDSCIIYSDRRFELLRVCAE